MSLLFMPHLENLELLQMTTFTETPDLSVLESNPNLSLKLAVEVKPEAEDPFIDPRTKFDPKAQARPGLSTRSTKPYTLAVRSPATLSNSFVTSRSLTSSLFYLLEIMLVFSGGITPVPLSQSDSCGERDTVSNSDRLRPLGRPR